MPVINQALALKPDTPLEVALRMARNARTWLEEEAATSQKLREALAATANAEPVCRCGHGQSAHDAGECWETNNHDQCPCSWYEPARKDGGE